ncbi:MAG: 3-deoxy-7-phosphoheptulonate synthase [Acidobacteriota bacterium]
MMTNGIEGLRARIDEADEALLEALSQRMKAVDAILREKEDHRLPLFDAAREKELMSRMAAQAAERQIDPRLAERVLGEIIHYAREMQSRRVQAHQNPELAAITTVTYQGTRGAYSWLACRKHFGDKVEAVGHPSFREAVQAVEKGKADLALLPIENSLAGSIYEVYDLLAQSRLHVVGEEILRIEHCLLGLKGVTLEQIRTVLSHPVALRQCTRFLSELPNAICRPYVDSADAVRKVRKDGDPTQAATASREAGELYGLEVLREGISDHPENYTRFWVIGRDPVSVDPRVPAKTSMRLVTEHKEGALVACLAALAAQGVNLTKLESRPRRGTPWQYQFYLDMDGNIGEERMTRALDDVRARARVVRILGCYPRASVANGPWSSNTAPGGRPARSSAPIGASSPKPLNSRRRKADPTIVWVSEVPVGEGSFVVMAGPCAVESRDQMMEAAAQVKACGAHILRGGAYKPRTSPYSFQGLGAAGVQMLVEAGQTHHLPVVSEVMDPEHVAAMAETVDLLQVGARNMQNYPLLRELGQVSTPVLLKRGMSSTLQELLMAAEYILAGGNQQVILCERGIRTFETATRCTLDLSAVPVLKELTHLPVIVDPSHATGKAPWVPPLSRASKAVGADGIIVEVHPQPEASLCDADQALGFDLFAKMMQSLT